MATAHGCEDQTAHENPLEGEEQVDESPVLALLSDDPHENDDISFEVSFPLQEGQLGFSSPSEEKINCSKILPHLLHLNS